MNEGFSFESLNSDSGAAADVILPGIKSKAKIITPDSKHIAVKRNIDERSAESDILSQYDEGVVVEELGLLFTDDIINPDEINEALRVLNLATRNNDGLVLQKYLQETSLKPEIRRAFEVADHHYMHQFPLENEDGIVNKLEDFTFSKKEFFSYFKQPDYLTGLEHDGEEAFYYGHIKPPPPGGGWTWPSRPYILLSNEIPQKQPLFI